MQFPRTVSPSRGFPDSSGDGRRVSAPKTFRSTSTVAWQNSTGSRFLLILFFWSSWGKQECELQNPHLAKISLCVGKELVLKRRCRCLAHRTLRNPALMALFTAFMDKLFLLRSGRLTRLLTSPPGHPLRPLGICVRRVDKDTHVVTQHQYRVHAVGRPSWSVTLPSVFLRRPPADGRRSFQARVALFLP